MDVSTRPLTPDRWDDLEAVIRATGCSMARGCWCMYYRETGRVEPPEGVSASEDRLLRGAIVHAEAHGAVALEAYPIDKPGRGHDTFLWNGVRSVYEREGFAEVARLRPGRPVMRRAFGTVG